ncbi:hypothetical protein TU62_06885 [Bacillus cereus]|nr:hypothetical protein TU62_06885 [Bacillus cereus]
MITLQLENYKFFSIPVWLEWNTSSKGDITHKKFSIIGLKETSNDIHITHPLSDFILSNWKYNAYNTQRKHCNNTVSFLNYLLTNKKLLGINTLKELKLVHGNDFLNNLSRKERTVGTVKDVERTLTLFYIWLQKKGCLPKVNETLFIKKETYQGTSYFQSPFEVIYPTKTGSKKEHMLPAKYIPLLLEIAVLKTKPIALGVYLQIFGGLRRGEVVNLKRSNLKRKLNTGDFLLTLKNQNFRKDIKDHSGSSSVKKPRDQAVLQIFDWGKILFADHINLYKDHTDSGALFINRDGKAMSGKSYSQYFNKLKHNFINFLKTYGNSEEKILANHLLLADWSTHIGRGTFTNLIAENTDNPLEIAFHRGDDNLLSSLTYMVKTDRMRKKIEDKFDNMHENYLPRLIDRNKFN